MLDSPMDTSSIRIPVCLNWGRSRLDQNIAWKLGQYKEWSSALESANGFSAFCDNEQKRERPGNQTCVMTGWVRGQRLISKWPYNTYSKHTFQEIASTAEAKLDWVSYVTSSSGSPGAPETAIADEHQSPCVRSIVKRIKILLPCQDWSEDFKWCF